MIAVLLAEKCYEEAGDPRQAWLLSRGLESASFTWLVGGGFARFRFCHVRPVAYVCAMGLASWAGERAWRWRGGAAGRRAERVTSLFGSTDGQGYMQPNTLQ